MREMVLLASHMMLIAYHVPKPLLQYIIWSWNVVSDLFLMIQLWKNIPDLWASCNSRWWGRPQPSSLYFGHCVPRLATRPIFRQTKHAFFAPTNSNFSLGALLSNTRQRQMGRSPDIWCIQHFTLVLSPFLYKSFFVPLLKCIFLLYDSSALMLENSYSSLSLSSNKSCKRYGNLLLTISIFFSFC